MNEESKQPILFVPKRWLRYRPWLNYDDYFNNYLIKDIEKEYDGTKNRIEVLKYNRENFGMVGGILGSAFAYAVGHYGGRPFVDKYGKYFFVKKSHVDIAQNWFDKYGIKAVFFSRMLPVVRTFISLPAGFAHVDMKKFFLYTFLGSLPWTALILAIGMMLGEGWKVMMEVGHEISLAFAVILVVICLVLYWQYKKKKSAK